MRLSTCLRCDRHIEDTSPCRDYCCAACKLWANTDASGGPDACWLWAGGFSDNGYGRIPMWRNGTRGYVYAHRLSAKLAGMDPSAGDCVMHACDNRLCVNPAHLRVATFTENNHDCKRKGRNNRGERHGLAKLTEDNVREIMAAQGNGQTKALIGSRFGVCQATVGNIWHGRSWRHMLHPQENER